MKGPGKADGTPAPHLTRMATTLPHHLPHAARIFGYDFSRRAVAVGRAGTSDDVRHVGPASPISIASPEESRFGRLLTIGSGEV